MNLLEFTALILRVVLSIGGIGIGYIFFLRVKEARGSGIDLSQFLGLGIFLLILITLSYVLPFWALFQEQAIEVDFYNEKTAFYIRLLLGAFAILLILGVMRIIIKETNQY